MSLRAALQACDDETLAALASVGLVRRARKDLEKDPPPPVSWEGEEATVEVEGLRVRLRAPVERSECPCLATGACRHLLAALLHARASADAPPEAPSPADEIAALDEAAVKRWAGPARDRAERLLAETGPPVLDEGPVLLARFPTEHAECRFLPGAALEGSLCTCETRRVCVHRIAAVLALRAQRGVGPPLPTVAAEPAAESAGAPRSRDEVLAMLRRVLRHLVAGGLCRVSPSAAERLRSLAAAGRATGMPRLERELRTLAALLESWRAREGAAASAEVLRLAARLEALAHSLRVPTPERLGEYQRTYRPMGEVELVGMGARQWRTPGGYRGLTVFFRAGAEWLTWSEARPADQAFDPADRYRMPGPWEGCPSPAVAAASTVRLRGGFRATGGRLSGRPSIRAAILGPARRPSPAVAVAELGRPDSLGLTPPEETEALAFFEPARWGPAAFHPLRQVLEVETWDRDGSPLLLVMPWRPWTQAAIRCLEAGRPPGTRVLGRVQRVQGRPALEPWVLFEGDAAVSLTLDLEAPPEAPADAPEAAEPVLPSGLRQLLAEGFEALVEAAEAGPAAAPPGRLDRLAAELAAVGLRTPAAMLRRTAEAVRAGTPEEMAEAVLRGGYVLDLALR